jgi:hypothetical protein
MISRLYAIAKVLRFAGGILKSKKAALCSIMILIIDVVVAR